MKTRSNIINYLIKQNKYSSYLEIGIDNPNNNFNKIECKNKTGVDPNKNTDYRMTSNNFFKQLNPTVEYDIVFIDGLHTFKAVLNDIENSLQHLSNDGTIVAHDCNPKTKFLARPYPKYHGGPWCGTTWKTIARLRMTRPDLEVCVVNTDYGYGIIRKGAQILFKPIVSKLRYSFLEKHRKELLNLCSVEEFQIYYARNID